jgi:tetratricopeptide (TPR) repeat protein
LAEAEEIVRTIGHRWHAANLSLTRGETELARGKYFDAHTAFEKALELAEQLGTRSACGEAHFGLARCAVKMADPEKAAVHGIQALQLFTEAGHYKADTVTQWLASVGPP